MSCRVFCACQCNQGGCSCVEGRLPPRAVRRVPWWQEMARDLGNPFRVVSARGSQD